MEFCFYLKFRLFLKLAVEEPVTESVKVSLLVLGCDGVCF